MLASRSIFRQRVLLSYKMRDVLEKQKPREIPKMLIVFNFSVLYKNEIHYLKNVDIKSSVFLASRKIKHNIPYLFHFRRWKPELSNSLKGIETYMGIRQDCAIKSAGTLKFPERD